MSNNVALYPEAYVSINPLLKILATGFFTLGATICVVTTFKLSDECKTFVAK